jgi:hypothetical protein
VRLRRETLTYFFKLGWDRYVFNKKHAVTRYIELLFLHLVGSTGHIVHSGASEATNVDALFIMLGWHRNGFDKKRARTQDADLVFLHLVGSPGHIVHSGASEA